MVNWYYIAKKRGSNKNANLILHLSHQGQRANCSLFNFSNARSDVKRPAVKEELKTLYLSEKAQEQVVDTLKYIHGPVSVLHRQEICLHCFF